MTTLLPPSVETPIEVTTTGSSEPTAPPGRGGRWLRGRPDDPAWARPALLGLLLVTLVAYLWDLSASGWANSFYSAAVEAGTHSWKAAFFGSFDSSNAITVDKPPASLWVMELSARIFGLSSWSVLVPQALEGVAVVALLYAAVRRVANAGAALVAGAVMATTPVAALIFRFNNPDALLVLLLVGAAYATVRALEHASTRWLILAGALLGFGFLTKYLQAFIVLPGFGLAYLIAAPTSFGRRLWQTIVLGVSTLVAAGWWVAVVSLTPAADRPYIGGSTDNSVLNLIFGYNGFGRLTGNETGSVGSGASVWGATGWLRMFNNEFGGQASWLIPAAFLGLVVALVATWRRPRTDALRASAIIWGSWLVLTQLVFSLSKGIIHQYYAVALAPGIGALVGIGGFVLWQHRSSIAARLIAAAGILVTAGWSAALLHRTPTWETWILPVVLITGVASAVGVALWTVASTPLRWAISVLAIVAAFLGPVAYVTSTVTTPHTGSLPTAGPAGQGNSFGGPGGPGGIGGFARFARLGHAQGSSAPSAARLGGGAPSSFAGGGAPQGATGGFPGGTGAQGGFPGGTAGGFSGGAGAGGGFPGGAGTGGGGFPGGAGGSTGGGFGGGSAAGSSHPSIAFGGTTGHGAGGFGGGAGGSLLQASTPSKKLTAMLKKDAGNYRWVAATVGSQSAAGYQLASDEPVMSIGGFNGTDPSPTLSQFIDDVKAHEIHYFISSGSGVGRGVSEGQLQGLRKLFSGQISPAVRATLATHGIVIPKGGIKGFSAGALRGGGGGGIGSSGQSNSIDTWVAKHFKATTIDGVTVYDLDHPTSGL